MELTIVSGQICPKTGIWSFTQEAIGTTDEIREGETAPWINGGPVTWWFMEE